MWRGSDFVLRVISTGMSCFRDDIVFIIYLYQRHIYPVDKESHLPFHIVLAWNVLAKISRVEKFFPQPFCHAVPPALRGMFDEDFQDTADGSDGKVEDTCWTVRNVNQNNLNNLHDVVGKGLNPVNPVNPVAGQERSIGHVSVMTSCPVTWEKSGEFNESWCPLVPRVGCSGALGGCLEMSGKPQGLLLNPKMRTREQDNEIQWTSTSTLLHLVGIPYAKKHVSTCHKRCEYAIVVAWSNAATCNIYIFGGEIVYRSVLAWLIATTVTALTCAAKQPRKKLSACISIHVLSTCFLWLDAIIL